MTFYKQLYAVTEAPIGLDRDLLDRSTREKTEAVAGIVRGTILAPSL